MRIVIDMGHTPTSPGAGYYLDELSCDRATGERVIAELERRGHTVYNSTAPDWMAYPDEVNYRCNYTNGLWGIDLFCSIHFNAGGGHGTEVLYFAGDGDGAWWASQISKNVSRALGLPNRGAKPNDWVGVICNTNPTAVLIEVCFVDNWDDAEAWHNAPWDSIIDAICDGIEGRDWDGESSDYDPQPEPQPEPQPAPSDDIRYRVSVDPSANEWCDEMVGTWDSGYAGDDYAGIYGRPIRWLSCQAPSYRVYTEDGGWLAPVDKYDPNDLVYGTAGDGSPILLLEISDPTIKYQVHTTAGEWLPWMIGNKDTAGSADDFAGNYTPIDAIRMQYTDEEDVQPEPEGTPIMGQSKTNVNQMVNFFESKGKPYPSNVYGKLDAPTIYDFCDILLDEALAEGVRAEVVFAQAMHETGWLQFGGDVKAEQCNFAGIGATGGGEPGHSFSSVRLGLRAQVQHLKAYASIDPLKKELIDPRFNYVTRGIAPTVEDLGGKWAPSPTYGTRLVDLMVELLDTDSSDHRPEPEPDPEPEPEPEPSPEPSPQPEPEPEPEPGEDNLGLIARLLQTLIDLIKKIFRVSD